MTKRPGKGLGLGLAIVNHVVRVHSGCLNMVAREEEGTMVRIYLPLMSSSMSDGIEGPV